MPVDKTADEQLDRAFTALGDPVRRAMVARLSRGEATVNELAEPFPITKQAVSRHIQVLEAAGLITRSRDGQRRPCRLDPVALEALTSWIDTYRLAVEAQYRRLDDVRVARWRRRAGCAQQIHEAGGNTECELEGHNSAAEVSTGAHGVPPTVFQGSKPVHQPGWAGTVRCFTAGL